MIQQLVYISTARGVIADADCREILAASRENNARDGITGLLVAGTTRFLQLLEGPPAAVRAAYARITADPRHFASVVLTERTVEARDCPEWAMGYVPCVSGQREGLQSLVERLADPIADENVKAQFVGFGELQGAQARVQGRAG